MARFVLKVSFVTFYKSKTLTGKLACFLVATFVVLNTLAFIGKNRNDLIKNS